jgi:thiamine biosynthesis protein ThiC
MKRVNEARIWDTELQRKRLEEEWGKMVDPNTLEEGGMRKNPETNPEDVKRIEHERQWVEVEALRKKEVEVETLRIAREDGEEAERQRQAKLEREETY